MLWLPLAGGWPGSLGRPKSLRPTQGGPAYDRSVDPTRSPLRRCRAPARGTWPRRCDRAAGHDRRRRPDAGRAGRRRLAQGCAWRGGEGAAARTRARRHRREVRRRQLLRVGDRGVGQGVPTSQRSADDRRRRPLDGDRPRPRLGRDACTRSSRHRFAGDRAGRPRLDRAARDAGAAGADQLRLPDLQRRRRRVRGEHGTRLEGVPEGQRPRCQRTHLPRHAARARRVSDPGAGGTSRSGDPGSERNGRRRAAVRRTRAGGHRAAEGDHRHGLAAARRRRWHLRHVDAGRAAQAAVGERNHRVRHRRRRHGAVARPRRCSRRAGRDRYHGQRLRRLQRARARVSSLCNRR